MGENYRRFAKLAGLDESLGLVFGWAIVSKENGKDYYDTQDDHIPEDSMLSAATDFMQSSRTAKEMHTGAKAGTVVFAFPLTTEIAKSMGVTTAKTGLMIAVKADSEMLEKFKSGELTGFSIGGRRLDDEDVGKGSGDLVDLLTGVTNEHQHGITVENFDGKQYVRVSTDKAPGEEYGHNHPIYLDNDRYVLGLVNGHTHAVDQEVAAQVLGDGALYAAA